MMRTTWTLNLCAAVASAAVLAGCTQEVGDNAQNRTAIDHPTDQQKQNLQMSVTGCLGTGTGTNQFVLTHVRTEPLATQPTDAQSAANVSLPDNSAVRLALNDEHDVSKLVGQTVAVTGLLTKTGADTIGTGGRPEAGTRRPEPRADKSQAATDQHHSDKVRQEAGPIGQDTMNNGTFPELTVQQIRGTGQKCTTSPAEERR